MSLEVKTFAILFYEHLLVGNAKTLTCWLPVNRPPMPRVNGSVFIICFSAETGIDIVKVLSTEFADFVKNHDNALYWCNETKIVPKRIRAELNKLRTKES